MMIEASIQKADNPSLWGLTPSRDLSWRAALASLAASVVLLFLSGVLATDAHAAAGERKLDPVLSLIGGCSEPETLDPVPDPGCPDGTHPPAGKFSSPRAVSTDFYGNIYVSSFGASADGSKGRIDVFDPAGIFITELKTTGPTSIAVDSKGNLYVIAEVESGAKPILRFEPSNYKPEDGEIAYGKAPATVSMPDLYKSAIFAGLAINPDNDHLFANFGGSATGGGLVEFASAAEAN